MLRLFLEHSVDDYQFAAISLFEDVDRHGNVRVNFRARGSRPRGPELAAVLSFGDQYVKIIVLVAFKIAVDRLTRIRMRFFLREKRHQTYSIAFAQFTLGPLDGITFDLLPVRGSMSTPWSTSSTAAL